MTARRALRPTPPRVNAGGFATPDRSDVATDCGLCRLGRALEIVADLIGAPVAELRAERTIIEVRSRPRRVRGTFRNTDGSCAQCYDHGGGTCTPECETCGKVEARS